MRYYDTRDLKPGHILARTVFGSDGRILIKAKTPLTPFLIQRLNLLGFPGAYVLENRRIAMQRPVVKTEDGALIDLLEVLNITIIRAL